MKPSPTLSETRELRLLRNFLICSAKSKKFIPISFYNSDDKICPNCGALSRSRALGEYVSKNFKNRSLKILDFSPHRSLNDFFKSTFDHLRLFVLFKLAFFSLFLYMEPLKSERK